MSDQVTPTHTSEGETVTVTDGLSDEGSPVAGPVTASHWQRSSLPRWCAIVIMAIVAFHATLISVGIQISQGNAISYLVAMPVWAAIIAVGSQRRHRSLLNIHDRQVDWILMSALLISVILIDHLLEPRLGASSQIWRIDVAALVIFVLAASMLFFGTRAVVSFWMTWVFVLACWPLPYQMVGSALGGGTRDFGLLNVALGAVAVGLSIGKPIRRCIGAMAATLLIGGVGVFVLSWAPSLVVELVPGIIAPLAVAYYFHTFVLVKPGGDSIWSKGSALGHITVPAKWRAALCALTVVTVVLIPLTAAAVPVSLDSSTMVTVPPAWAKGPLVPNGWRAASTSHYAWAASYFGNGAQWERYRYIPSQTSVQKHSFVRQVIDVDVLTTSLLGTLSVYPSPLCYNVGTSFQTSPRSIALGNRVSAQLVYSSTDDVDQPTNEVWVLLTWVWKIGHGTGTRFERITVLTPDLVQGGGKIPKPSAPSGNANFLGTVSAIVRGSVMISPTGPDGRAIANVEAFSRAIVHLQTAGRRSNV